MGIIFVFAFAFFLGYVYGYWVKPNQRLREKTRDLRDRYRAILEEGRMGVYKTIVMDKDKSSELVVEVKELAVTELGQVKVQYLSAFYKNPEFRTKKGDALLGEVSGMLGEFLPLHEIEWYETNDRDEKIREHLHSFEKRYKNHFSV